MTFSMAAECVFLPGVLPAGSKQDQWEWLFNGRIPGILALFSALKGACSISKKSRN
jgi:hypothetical protein